MSNSKRRRRFRRFRVLCAACQERKARFRYRGEVRADRDHTLCFECYRRELDRSRARRLSEGRTSVSLVQAFEESRTLNDRKISHCRRMLKHLKTVARCSDAMTTRRQP